MDRNRGGRLSTPGASVPNIVERGIAREGSRDPLVYAPTPPLFPPLGQLLERNEEDVVADRVGCFSHDRGCHPEIATGVATLDVRQDAPDQRLSDPSDRRRAGGLTADHASDHLAEDRATAEKLEDEFVERGVGNGGIRALAHVTRSRRPQLFALHRPKEPRVKWRQGGSPKLEPPICRRARFPAI